MFVPARPQDKFIESPILRLNEKDRYEFVPDLETYRPVNDSNMINYLQALDEFYTRLSETDWKALSIIDFKIYEARMIDSKIPFQKIYLLPGKMLYPRKLKIVKEIMLTFEISIPIYLRSTKNEQSKRQI